MLQSLLVCLFTAAVSSTSSAAPAFPSPANGTAYSAKILELARAHQLVKGRVNAHQLVNATAARPPHRRREFPCAPWDTRKRRRAENVHELQPADIAAVGALVRQPPCSLAVAVLC